MSHCPDPETLATFLEGGLSDEGRRAVEAHAADCDRCYFTMRETQSFRAEERASSGDRRLVLAQAAMAAAAVLAVLVSAFWLARAPTDPRETLAAALRDTPSAYRARATLGRVSLEVPWAPWQGVERAAVDPLRNPDAWPIWEAIGPSQRRARTETAALALQGLAHLVLGQGEQAAESLENVHAIGEGDADTMSDLSAAYLQISLETRDPDAPHRALRWASRALALDPDHPGALFNRALALETLGLVGEATKAWSRYLEVDGTSPWADEARKGLETLEAKAAETERSNTPPPADPEELSAWGRRFPQAAREHLQRVVMPAWGARYLAGDERHESSLREAAVLADVIAHRQRDPSFAVMVADTRRRAAEHPASARLEARGHVAFGEGWPQLLTDPEESVRQLTLATDLWGQAGSAWAPWGRVWMLHALYFMGERTPTQVRQEAEFLLETLDSSETPLLWGRAAWLQGTLAMYDLRHDLAILSLGNAFQVFDTAHERDHASFLAFLVAEAHSLFGNTTSAWEWIDKSLKLTGPGSTRYARTLIGVGTIAKKAEEPEVALAFLDEGLALEKTEPIRIDGMRFRTKILADLGRHGEAREDLRRSRELLERLEPSGVRDRLDAEVLLDQAEIEMVHDPEVGRALTHAAWRRWGDRGLDLRILRLHLLDAEGFALADEPEGAADSLDRAARLLRESHSAEGLQALELPDRARRIFELLLDARWELDRDPVATLRIAERARRFGTASWQDSRNEVGSLGAAIPEDVVVLYFEVLADHTLAWVVTRDEVEVLDLPLSRERLHGLVLENHRRLQVFGAEATETPLAHLLREPLGVALRKSAREIVVVPDEVLFDVPFPTLSPGPGADPVGLTRVVSLAFELGFGGPGEASAEARPSGRRGTLVVADPAVDEVVFPRLPALRHAREEADAILRLDPAADVLLGAAADVESFKSLASGRRIIHLATHALANSRRPWRSVLPLAPSGGDSPLFASEIAGLSLGGTELVVLSSCDSGRSTEGVGGLARAFLDAGAENVIGARWPVRDRATAELLEDFYRRLYQGDSPAEALQGAQRIYRLRHLEDSEDHTWAAFQLFRAS